MGIQFNHNGVADGPGWDDVAYGALKEAIRMVDRGEVKQALRVIEEAKHAVENELEKRGDHDCWENAVPYVSDGALGHGWECGSCGAFLQAG